MVKSILLDTLISSAHPITMHWTADDLSGKAVLKKRRTSVIKVLPFTGPWAACEQKFIFVNVRVDNFQCRSQNGQ
jgi:hypothetical protein